MTKLLTALLSLAIAAAIFVVYTQPAYTKAKAIQAEVAQYDAALDKSRELQELKRSLLARYNTFSSDQLTRLSKLLPDHIDNVRLTLDLDSMAARHGMAIQNVTLNTPAKTTTDDKKAPTVLGTLGSKHRDYDSLTLQFVTAGTYSDFISFMNDLESSLRIVDIVGLTIEPSNTAQPGGSDEPFYRYNVSIRTYWLK